MLIRSLPRAFDRVFACMINQGPVGLASAVCAHLLLPFSCDRHLLFISPSFGNSHTLGNSIPPKVFILHLYPTVQTGDLSTFIFTIQTLRSSFNHFAFLSSSSLSSNFQAGAQSIPAFRLNPSVSHFMGESCSFSYTGPVLEFSNSPTLLLKHH